MIQAALARIDVQLASPTEILDLFQWAALICTTRGFGHPEVPNINGMCPVMDLINHSHDPTRGSFYLTPEPLWDDMRDIAASHRADLEMEQQAYEQARGFVQESEDDTLCADEDQHVDLFPPKYYNYHPVGVTAGSEPRPFDAVAVEALFADNNSKTSLE